MPAAKVGQAHIEPFFYPDDEGDQPSPSWTIWAEEPAAPQQQVEAAPPPVVHPQVDEELAQLRQQFQQMLSEETQRSLESGREQGRQQGRQEERDAQSATNRAHEELVRQQAAELISNFTLERDRYLRAVEAEVVQLALNIASRILRREAQMDPLLLTGAVRVALGQLAETTELRLVVPEHELRLWSDSLALLPNLPLKPAVVADERMQIGECRLESDLGSVDLGFDAQLAEIERGFFDGANRTRRGSHGKTDPIAALRERYS